MSGTINIPCCYALIRRGDKILFVLRQNTGFMDGKYSLPAGHVEPGESFSQGAAREALEEVGVTVLPQDLQQVYAQHRYQNSESIRVDVFFEATKWSGEPVNAEPHKHAKIEWISVDDLSDAIMDYQLRALQGILKGETYSEIGWTIDKIA